MARPPLRSCARCASRSPRRASSTRSIPSMPFGPNPEFRKLSPLGKIPALTDGDATLPDSSVICAYLERKYPERPLYPSDPYAYGRALWFEEYADSALVAVIGPKIFFQKVVNPMLLRPPARRGGGREGAQRGAAAAVRLPRGAARRRGRHRRRALLDRRHRDLDADREPRATRATASTRRAGRSSRRTSRRCTPVPPSARASPKSAPCSAADGERRLNDPQASPATSAATAPAAEYEARLAARRASLVVSERAHRHPVARVGSPRFVGGLALAWLVLDRAALPAITLLVPLLAFVGLVLRHGRITRERERWRGAVRYYERGLARLDDALARHRADARRLRRTRPSVRGRPRPVRPRLAVRPGVRRAHPDRRAHARGLARRTRRSRRRSAPVRPRSPSCGRGSTCARSWRRRRRSCAPRWRPIACVAWGARAARRSPASPCPLVAALLSALTIATLVLAMRPRRQHLAVHRRGRPADRLPAADPRAHERGARRRRSRRTRADHAARDPAAARARELREPAARRGCAASCATRARPRHALIRGLQLRMELNDSRRNQLLRAALAAAALAGAARVRDRALARAPRRRIGRWLDALGEIEALGVARRLRLRAPRRPLPRARHDAGPLLRGRRRSATRCSPDARCVRNDLRTRARAARADRQRLEHVGQEHAAAHGRAATSCWRWPARRCAPTRCALSPLAVGASIRVARLAAGRPLALLRRDPAPAADRRRRARRRRRCSSCSTRSCTAPTRTTAASAPRPCVRDLRRARRDRPGHDARPRARRASCRRAPRAPRTSTSRTTLEDGAMLFDYRMRPGVVQKSNALALMRAVGLEV